MVTNGGQEVASGGATVAWLLIATAPVGVAVQVSINAMSRVSDAAVLGWTVSPRIAWSTELSSGIAIIALLPGIWWAAGKLRPRVVGWVGSIVGHVVASIAFSTVHVTAMTLLRWALIGRAFAPVPTFDVLLYEYRKDAWSYALLACILASARWIRSLVEQPIPPLKDSSPAGCVLAIQDGTRRYMLPLEEIDYVEAAGNYVEVVAGGTRLLHRSTLSKVGDELGCGFVRIHRSRLVNVKRMRLIETNASGDFEVEIIGGERVKGSRRFRPVLKE